MEEKDVVKLLRETITDLGQLFIGLCQLVHGVVEDLFYQSLFLVRVEVQLGHLHSISFTLFPTEAENDDWLHLFFHDHFHYLKPRENDT